MKKFLLITVVFVVFGATCMELMRRDPGYLLIRIGNTAIETSFWAAVICFLVGLIFLFLMYRTIVYLFRVLDGSVHYLSRRKQTKLKEKTERGMINYVEGNWLQAQKDLKGVARAVDQPLLPYLAAAQSAFELGDIDETRRLLCEAEKTAPEDDFAVAVLQARLALMDKNYEQSLAALRRVYRADQPNPTVLKLLKDVLVELKDWEALKVLIPQFASLSSTGQAELVEFEKQVYVESFSESVGFMTDDQGLADLYTLIKAVPKKFKYDVDLAIIYAKKLVALGDIKEASRHIEKVLKKDWSTCLSDFYLTMPGGDEDRRYKLAQEWAKKRSDDYVLLASLGSMAARRGEIAHAKAFFEASLTVKESAKTYSLYGSVLAQEGDYKRSTEYFEKGLSLTMS